MFTSDQGLSSATLFNSNVLHNMTNQYMKGSVMRQSNITLKLFKNIGLKICNYLLPSHAKGYSFHVPYKML